ncbi:MAG: ankyrin repeat domain-containing protein [Candidatus Riflebacteria bacterium]|nr:ankyrin repeat domain-containing protein [Candidatus Riflebacteria bacterium]
MKLRALCLICMCLGFFANGLCAENDIYSPDFWKTATIQNVKELIQHKTKIRKNNNESEKVVQKVFFRAVEMCPDPKIIETLVELGADVEGPEHENLRHAAAHNSNPKVIQTLVRLGANINARSQFGRTPLMFSIDNPNLKVVETLIQLGAEVNAKDNEGNTALGLAAWCNNNPKFFELLVTHGADVNVRLFWDQTPLMRAAQHYPEQKEIIETLIRLGANPNATDNRGRNYYDHIPEIEKSKPNDS